MVNLDLNSGFVDILRSPFFNVNPEVDNFVKEYLERIIFTLFEAIEEQLSIVVNQAQGIVQNYLSMLSKPSSFLDCGDAINQTAIVNTAIGIDCSYLKSELSGNVVLLYASMHNDVPVIINLSGRFALERGIDGRLGKEFMQRIKKDGFIDVKDRTGGNVVLLYASMHNDVPVIINLSGRFALERGIDGRLGKEFMQRIKKDGFIDVKDRTGKVEFRVTEESLMDRLTTDMRAACHAIDKECRVLTIHGSADEIVPSEDAFEFDKLIPNHKLHIIEGRRSYCRTSDLSYFRAHCCCLILQFGKLFGFMCNFPVVLENTTEVQLAVPNTNLVVSLEFKVNEKEGCEEGGFIPTENRKENQMQILERGSSLASDLDGSMSKKSEEEESISKTLEEESFTKVNKKKGKKAKESFSSTPCSTRAQTSTKGSHG
ncbi:hypothetical protein MA16_Dca007967 [Dendrobium catenatum]|uniref:Uncharacterized protein n=1 Tax=Dendrobium catenatum TaxID=906689 RepID=A0A2I0XJE8_9ASPA|nr:hypothetical protein MA16_Dca007967 [Dendrobium catenatum]